MISNALEMYANFMCAKLVFTFRDMDAVSYASQIITIIFFIVQFGLYTFPAEGVAFEVKQLNMRYTR